RKLQETERHLERIGDIIRELASRVDPLREQAAKARQYVDLKQRADKLEIAVSVMVLKDTQEKLEQLQVTMAAECDQFDLLTTQRHKQSALAEQLRLQLTEIDEMVQSLSQEYYGLQSQKEKGEGQRNLAISRRDNGAEKLARLQTELQELEAEAACQREQIAALRVQEDQTALAVGDLESRIAVGAGGEQEWQEEAALLAEQLDEKKEIAYQIAGILTVLHNKQGFQEQLVEKARLRREKLMRQQEEFVQTSQNCKERLAQIVVAMADNTAQSQAVAVDLSEKENAMKQAAAMAQDLTKREGEAKYHNASLKTKVAMRKEMAQSYEGFYPGVRELLRANKKGQAPSGIVDAVANLLEVPTQYRGALELYLGGALQNIVCVSAVAAKEGIAWLKRQDAGRATFLPLDKLRVRAKMDFSAALKLSGVFGCGADLVGCAAAYEPARDFLLNNMLLVKDMDTALKAAEIIHFRASVVTLDGDIINPGASMAGGSRKQKSSDMLSKQSQLKEAEQQFSQAALQLAAITAQLREARENSDAISAHMDQLLAESRQFAATGAELRREQDRVADEQAAAERQWDSCRGEQQSLEDEITEAQDNIQQLQEEYQCREQENRLLLAEIDHFQEKLKGKTATLDQSRQGIARQREDLAALKQKAQGQTAALIKLRQDSETMARAQEEKFADCGAAEKELAVYGDDIVAAERNLTVLARQMLDI
ncbi:MAG: hypothetical protein RRY35_06350, partial [Clostridiales bacterium]